MELVVETHFDVSQFKLFSTRSNINPFTLCDFSTLERVDSISLGSGFTNGEFWGNKHVSKFKENYSKNKDNLKYGPIQFKFQTIQQMFFYSGYLQQTQIGICFLVREFRQSCIQEGRNVRKIDAYIDKAAKVRLPFFEYDKFENQSIPQANWELIMAAVEDTTEYEMQLKGQRDYEAFTASEYKIPMQESNTGWIIIGGSAAALGVLALSLR